MRENFYSKANSTTTPLADTEVFTGVPVECWQYNSIIVTCLTDKSGKLYLEFSDDQITWNSPGPFVIEANIKELHRLTPTGIYFRVRCENDSGEDQTKISLNSFMGQYNQLTSNLNNTIQSDTDTIVSRTVTLEDEVALNKYSSYVLINKIGRYTDFDTSTVPHDFWSNGGVYTGFPTGSPEEFVIELTDAADIGGTVMFAYLEDFDSTFYSIATVTTTGLTTNTGITGIRAPLGQFDNGGPVNVGNVILRHITTTTNVFISMPIGRCQTTQGCTTIPATTIGIIKYLAVNLYKSKDAVIEGDLWVRELGKSPRLIRPFSASSKTASVDKMYGGLAITGFADIAVRASAVSTNDVTAFCNMDILLKRFN